MKFRFIIHLAFAIFIPSLFIDAVAQSPFVTTSTDKKGILIGEHFKLSVVVTVPANKYGVYWFRVPDSMEHFEVIRRNKIDTFVKNDQAGLKQNFTLTSFDSGLWKLPSFAIKFQPLDGAPPTVLYTDSIEIPVSYQPDSTNVLRDIKPVREAIPKDYFWYWVIGALVLLLLIALVVWIYRRGEKKQKTLPARTQRTAFEEAMKEIEMLRKMQPSTPADIKSFHLKLTELLKRYLSRTENRNYFNKTTEQVLILLDEKGLERESLSNAAAALRSGDAVKFAKYIPPDGENMNALGSVQELIELVNKKVLSKIADH